MDDIFARIRHALEKPVASTEISATISAVHAALEHNLRRRAEHEALIVDPLSDTEGVRSADRSLAETHLTEKRLAEAARRLGMKLADVREVEVEAERRVSYDRAKIIRDKAAAEIRAAWVKHATGLVAVVELIYAADAAVAAAYTKPPKGETTIDGVAEGIVKPGLMTNSVVPFVDHLAIPDVPKWGAPGYMGSYLRDRGIG